MSKDEDDKVEKLDTKASPAQQVINKLVENEKKQLMEQLKKDIESLTEASKVRRNAALKAKETVEKIQELEANKPTPKDLGL